MSDNFTYDNIPPGFKFRHTLRVPRTAISRIKWSPDGQTLVSTLSSGSIYLLDALNGRLCHTLEERIYPFTSLRDVAWSPDSRILVSTLEASELEEVEKQLHRLRSYDEFDNFFTTFKLWDAETGELRQKLTGPPELIYGIDWSPAGQILAAGGSTGIIWLYDIETGRSSQLKGNYSPIFRVAWSPSGKLLASGGPYSTIKVWDTERGRLLYELKGYYRETDIVWSPSGKLLASGGQGRTIKVWDINTGKLLVTLEGHKAGVPSVSFSFDEELLASNSHDRTVRIWRCDTWESVAILDVPRHGTSLPGLSFNPTAPMLATFGDESAIIHIWDLDVQRILNTASTPKSVQYTNAKVVLVGETGVGKTGLGVRLAEGVWRPTPGSTHGMKVWLLHSEAEREVMLWDFAGQDEYRLVHQLFLNETNVALILYDPTKSQDTFEGIDYWEKALRNVVQGDVRKILVAARVDVGGVRMTAADIETHCKAHGFVAHFATSAESGEGCDQLCAAIMAAIPWESLPRTSSPEIFKRIKDFLASVRQGRRVLVRQDDLLAEFNVQAGGEATTEAEFHTVIGHIETAGLIKRLSFGDFVLLKPELLNGYASDIVDAARRHPDGLGAVRKADVLDARVRPKDEGGLKASDRIFLLHATVELLVRFGLALEQDGNLVFPSKFNRRMPPLEKDPVVEVEFSFEGPVENLYTTLVVKLYYGGIFKLKMLWKNAAEFLNGRGLVCGFQLQNNGDGQGRLKVFYAEDVRGDDKALFLKIVADHFREKRVEVRRQRIYRCPHCREFVRDPQAIAKALERNVKEMPCLYCFKTFPLMDVLEVLYHDDRKFLAQIVEMENRAESSMERGGEIISASAELRTENFKYWAGGADIATVAIVFTDMIGGTKLNVEFRDEAWRPVREAHFARARELINRGHGYLIKTNGDSVMAAFHSAVDALDFTLALYDQTGHDSIKIRAGIHVGPVEVTSEDAFGQQVSMAARVEAKAKGGGIWVSARVKEDIDVLGAVRHRHLEWKEHPDEELRGFHLRYTLWSIE